MGHTLIQLIPKQGAEIVLVLFLSFLIGLEREEQKVATNGYRFGGVRTFPLLGLLGYTLGLVLDGGSLLAAAGLVVVGAFLWQSYRYKLERETLAGMTTELSGLLTYGIGILISHEHFWVATAVTVIGVALLEMKTALEGFTKRVPGDEILTFAKFLLISAVILPLVPNQSYGAFGFNPFNVWLVVVAVSTISYVSYLLQVWTKGLGGVLVSALLGGAYSSTVTTVVLARRAREQSRPHLYSGAMLAASGVMYLRVLALLGLFNRQLLRQLGLPFLLLAAVGVAGGYLWARRLDEESSRTEQPLLPKNPLELGAAFLFAGVFVATLFITHFALLYLGRAGLYALATIMGVTDVDPFILSVAESSSTLTPTTLAGGAIVIAAASNNFIKGIYAFSFGDPTTGRQGLVLLAALALLGLLPLLF